MDQYLRFEYPQKFRSVSQKLSLIKLSKFEFPSFIIQSNAIKDSFKRIG